MTGRIDPTTDATDTFADLVGAVVDDVIAKLAALPIEFAAHLHTRVGQLIDTRTHPERTTTL